MPTITVAGPGVVVDVGPDETILAALARHGYACRTGCRRGGCGICKMDVLHGRVGYPVRVATSVLSEQERDAGVCVSCRAVPDGDVVVALRADDRLRCVAPLLAALTRTA